MVKGSHSPTEDYVEQKKLVSDDIYVSECEFSVHDCYGFGSTVNKH